MAWRVEWVALSWQACRGAPAPEDDRACVRAVIRDLLSPQGDGASRAMPKKCMYIYVYISFWRYSGILEGSRSSGRLMGKRPPILVPLRRRGNELWPKILRTDNNLTEFVSSNVLGLDARIKHFLSQIRILCQALSIHSISEVFRPVSRSTHQHQTSKKINIHEVEQQQHKKSSRLNS